MTHRKTPTAASNTGALAQADTPTDSRGIR